MVLSEEKASEELVKTPGMRGGAARRAADSCGAAAAAVGDAPMSMTGANDETSGVCGASVSAGAAADASTTVSTSASTTASVGATAVFASSAPARRVVVASTTRVPVDTVATPHVVRVAASPLPTTTSPVLGSTPAAVRVRALSPTARSPLSGGSSPGSSRSVPPAQRRSVRVWFAPSPMNQSVDITPYARVYGMHPSLFDFDQNGGMQLTPRAALDAQLEAAAETRGPTLAQVSPLAAPCVGSGCVPSFASCARSTEGAYPSTPVTWTSPSSAYASPVVVSSGAVLQKRCATVHRTVCPVTYVASQPPRPPVFGVQSAQLTRIPVTGAAVGLRQGAPQSVSVIRELRSTPPAQCLQFTRSRAELGVYQGALAQTLVSK